MNEIVRQLTERRSVRAFTDQEMDEAAVEAILREMARPVEAYLERHRKGGKPK